MEVSPVWQTLVSNNILHQSQVFHNSFRVHKTQRVANVNVKFCDSHKHNWIFAIAHLGVVYEIFCRMSDAALKSMNCSVTFKFSGIVGVSNLLNTGLDSETLALLVGLCETGLNPEALVTVVNEVRKECQVTLFICPVL